jgi:hypothetical protein
MTENRPRNCIERLPEIIEGKEDVSSRSRDAGSLPARAGKSSRFVCSVRPRRLKKGSGTGGIEIARSKGYRAEEVDRFLRHSAVFGVDEVQRLHELFSLVGDFPSCEILVKGKKVPYARELWLPFFWFFKKDEA